MSHRSTRATTFEAFSLASYLNDFAQRVSATALFALTLLHAANPGIAASKEETLSRPNIVLIFSDDQGVNDVGCYGSEIPTPHIDMIAQQGVKFTSWYSASSICTPSRFGLLTGQNPCRSRDKLLSALMFLAEEDRVRGLQEGETTIGHALQKGGYTTAIIGKWHLGHGGTQFLPVNHGFELFRGHTGGCIDYFTMTYGVTNDWYENTDRVPKNGYATELITYEAVNFLEKQKNADAPFFLYLPYNAPHFGKGWNPSKGETVNIMQAQGSDLKRVSFIEDKIRREFAAMVVSLDDAVGQVSATLDRLGMTDNTLLVFLTDHGGDPTYGGSNKPLRGDKATLFEGGLKVPCVMKWPNRIGPAGTVDDRVRSSLDLFPTFCAVANVKPDKALDGVAVTFPVRDSVVADDRTLFWQTGSHVELGRGSWTALRRGSKKYVRDNNGREFVFDLDVDPNESKNLANADDQLLRHLRKNAQKMAARYAAGETP